MRPVFLAALAMALAQRAIALTEPILVCPGDTGSITVDFGNGTDEVNVNAQLVVLSTDAPLNMKSADAIDIPPKARRDLTASYSIPQSAENLHFVVMAYSRLTDRRSVWDDRTPVPFIIGRSSVTVYDDDYNTIPDGGATPHAGVRVNVCTDVPGQLAISGPTKTNVIQVSTTEWNAPLVAGLKDGVYMATFTDDAGRKSTSTFVIDRKAPPLYTKWKIFEVPQNSGKLDLFWAAENGEIEIAKILLSTGAAIDGEGWYGTPIDIAAYNGKTDMISLLLKNRANINSGKYGSPACSALEMGHRDSLDLLLASGAKTDGACMHEAIKQALERHDWSSVGDVLSHGAYLASRSTAEYSYIEWAVDKNDCDVARFLLTHDYDVSRERAHLFEKSLGNRYRREQEAADPNLVSPELRFLLLSQNPKAVLKRGRRILLPFIDSSTPTFRAVAISVVPEAFGPDEGIKICGNALADGSPEVSDWAAQCLLRFPDGPKRSLASVLGLLKSGHCGYSCSKALAAAGRADFGEWSDVVLSSSPFAAHHAAMAALDVMGPSWPEAEAVLLSAVAKPDPMLKSDALYAFKVLKSSSPAVLAAVDAEAAAEIAAEKYPGAIEKAGDFAIGVLQEMGAAEPVKRLVDMRAKRVAAARVALFREIGDALPNRSHEEVPHILGNGLAEKFCVWEGAYDAFTEALPRDASDFLVRKLRDPRAQEIAAYTLVNGCANASRNELRLEGIKRTLGRPRGPWASILLAKLGDKSYAEKMKRYARQSVFADVRVAALRTLPGLIGVEARPVLEASLKDQNEVIRKEAQWALSYDHRVQRRSN